MLADARLAGWDGLGLAVQAYQKRALPLVDWVAALARRTRHRMPARLVKGAYWDSEIKLAQVQGHPDYPVFTRKAATDVSWLACRAAHAGVPRRDLSGIRHAQRAQPGVSFWSARAISDFEMQRLHGMGEALYHGATYPVRVYAPVGTHEDLLAYLVRRLLENGANTSFVHRLVDPAVPEEAIVADPVARVRALGASRNPRIPLPRDLYPDRENSAGLTLPIVRLHQACWLAIRRHAEARDDRRARNPQSRRSPHRWSARSTMPGRRKSTRSSACSRAAGAIGTRPAATHRAAVLDRAADLIEASREELLFLLAREAGKTLADGIAEIREAADFCRWYALHARDANSLRRANWPGRPASAIPGRWAVAACSPRSRRGIFRWRSSPARSPPRSPPAMRWPPSRPSRRR